MSRFYLWVFKRAVKLAGIRGVDVMMRVRGDQYLYLDYFGDLYRLKPTCQPGSPLIVVLEERR